MFELKRNIMNNCKSVAYGMINAYGLEKALKIARMRYTDDRRLQRPTTVESFTLVETLEALSDAMDDLDHVAQTDPVATIARKLHNAGVAEIDLQAALGARAASPIGNELQNKYRDATHGWTINKYGHKILI
jgi:hypothetical protein